MPSEEICANCHRTIDASEEAFVWKDNIVCSECYQKLSVPKRAAQSTPVSAETLPCPPLRKSPIGKDGRSTKSHKELAKSSLYLSVLGLLIWPVAIYGIVQGFKAKVGMDESGNEDGRAIALWGIALGIIGTAYPIIIGIIMAVLRMMISQNMGNITFITR